MNELAAAIIPPAPPVPTRDLPPVRHLISFIRNTLSIFPDYAFDVLISRARVVGIDSLLINDPAGVRHVLVEARERYRRPMSVNRVVRPVSGDGLFLSEGEVWKRQRRSLAPAFTPAAVGELIPHFQAAGEGLLRRLDCASSANLSGAFHATALDAVLRALFSLEPEGADRGLALMVRRYFMGPGRPNLLDGLAKRESDFAFAGASRRRFQKAWFVQVDRIVAERRASPGPVRRDLLSLLLEACDPETGQPLTDGEIRDQTATMLLAGFETTSRLLFWASYLLALDQDAQERLRTEIRGHPPDAVTSLADLEQWQQLREVLLEALRLYPSAPHLVRDAVEADEIMGEVIGPGAQIWISPWVIHRHRRFWEKPTAFMPSRFKDQRSPWTSGTFIPFGMGPRICIGASFAMAEAEIVLASLLSRYRIGLADQRPVLPVANVTIRPSFEPKFNLASV